MTINWDRSATALAHIAPHQHLRVVKDHGMRYLAPESKEASRFAIWRHTAWAKLCCLYDSFHTKKPMLQSDSTHLHIALNALGWPGQRCDKGLPPIPPAVLQAYMELDSATTLTNRPLPHADRLQLAYTLTTSKAVADIAKDLLAKQPRIERTRHGYAVITEQRIGSDATSKTVVRAVEIKCLYRGEKAPKAKERVYAFAFGNETYEAMILARERKYCKLLQDVPNVIKMRCCRNLTKVQAGTTVRGFGVLMNRGQNDLEASLGRSSLQQQLRIANGVATAVAGMHKRGIAHCDIKPRNIVLDAEGNASVIDFGTACTKKDPNEVLTCLGCYGTRGYTAPECYAPGIGRPPRVDHAQLDVWALGCTLYALYFGSFPPWFTITHADLPGTAEQHKQLLKAIAADTCFSKIPPQPTKPEHQYLAVIRDMLTVDPKQRPSMAEVQRRLAAVQLPPPQSGG